MRPQESAEDERMQQARIKTTTIWLASHEFACSKQFVQIFPRSTPTTGVFGSNVKHLFSSAMNCLLQAMSPSFSNQQVISFVALVGHRFRNWS
jgi:hypothetical protein